MSFIKKIGLIFIFVTIPLILFGQTQRWVFQYNGQTGVSDDFAHSVIYGADGNIYAAGLTNLGDTICDFTIISTTNTGALRWVYQYYDYVFWGHRNIAKSLVYGLDGNIYAAGVYSYSLYPSILVVSLTNSGTERWTYSPLYGARTLEDRPISIICGPDSNIYGSGTVVNEVTNAEDIIVFSLTPSGTERWVYTYNGTGNSSDFSTSMTADSNGNIYVVGSSMGANGNMDIIVIKLSPTGIQQWVARYNGPDNGNDFGNSIVFGSDGYVYIAGTCWRANTSYDFLVLSLSSYSGGVIWLYSYNGPGNSVDIAKAITFGADGWVYAAGFTTGAGTKTDFTIIKLSFGISGFIYRYNGTDNSFDCANSIVYGTDSNIYAAGYIISNTTKDDFTIISLTNTGTYRWAYLFNDPLNSSDEARSIVYGTDGNIYSAGYSAGGSTTFDFTLISLGVSLHK
ncbi:MAG: SBBP repeat-containing protein [bacterium]